MRILTYSILIFIFLATSCKKKDYPDDTTTNAPVFYFKGEVNGEPVSLSAGENDYYMFSSQGQDSNKVYNFMGELKKNTCDNCGNRLFIQLNDFKTSVPGSAVDISSSIKADTLPIFTNYLESYSVKFESFYNKTGGTYLWNFGDGQTSTEANPEHVYKSKGRYKITLKITGSGSFPCVSSISYVSKIGYENKCESYISGYPSGDTVQFNQTSKGVAPLKFFWSFGDGETSTLANPEHTYPFKGARPVVLRVIDAAGDTAIANYNSVTGNDNSSCAANFRIVSVDPIPGNNPFGLSSAFVKWHDASGKLFTSTVDQPSDSYFEILSAEAYDPNEKNEKTMKLKLRFKCRVYNGTQFITINNAEAVVAVAYH